MGIASIAKTGLNYAGRLLFDDKFSSKVTSRLRASQRVAKNNYGNRFHEYHKQIGGAFQKADSFTAKNGTVWQGLKSSVKSLGTDTKALWKSDAKFFKKIGGTFKQLTKRIPLIGTALMVAFEIPNIVKAAKDGGLVAGAAEAGKSGLRLAAGIALGAIGTAILGPIGSFAGFIVGDYLGKLIVGKSYSEKQADREEDLAKQQEAAQVAFQGAQVPTEVQGQVPTPEQVQQPAFAGATNPFAQPALNQQQLGQLQQALYGQTQLNDDFMFNAQPKLNFQA